MDADLEYTLEEVMGTLERIAQRVQQLDDALTAERKLRCRMAEILDDLNETVATMRRGNGQ